VQPLAQSLLLKGRLAFPVEKPPLDSLAEPRNKAEMKLAGTVLTRSPLFYV